MGVKGLIGDCAVNDKMGWKYQINVVVCFMVSTRGQRAAYIRGRDGRVGVALLWIGSAPGHSQYAFGSVKGHSQPADQLEESLLAIQTWWSWRLCFSKPMPL